MTIALITGGASGLGEAIVRRLHADGMHVFIADIDEQGGRNLAAELGQRANFSTLDVTREDQWDALLDEIKSSAGRLDVLVNNAGITTVGTIEDLPFELLQRELNINLGGVFLGCQKSIPLMRSTGGAIINIASGCSKKVRADLAGYNASKAAVTMLTKCVAKHCASKGYGIRANSVHPGAMHTPILDKVLSQSDNPDQLMASFIADHPIGRIGQPTDIASMVAFLASDEATFITGAEFFVDGGMTL